MRKLYAITVIFAIIAVAGCAKAPSGAVTFVCEKPYIQVGQECCLDKDNNKICDSDDEPIQPNIPTAQPNSSNFVNISNVSSAPSLAKNALDYRTREEIEMFGSWCVRSDYNELVDPIITVDRWYLLGADHYYMDSANTLITDVVEGSNFLAATGFLTPFVEYAYQAYEISNLKVDGRLHGLERDIQIPNIPIPKQSLKTQSYDDWTKSEDIYLLQLFPSVEKGDILQYKLEYDAKGKHFVTCEWSNLSVTDKNPNLEIRLINKSTFGGGPHEYTANYVIGINSSTIANNIFNKQFPGYEKVKPYAYFFYRNDTISIQTSAYYYPLIVEWPDGRPCYDPRDCAITLRFKRYQCEEMTQNLCRRESYTVLGVQDPVTKEHAETIFQLNKNDFSEICSTPC